MFLFLLCKSKCNSDLNLVKLILNIRLIIKVKVSLELKKFQTDSVNHKSCNKYKLADSQVCMLVKMINSSGDMIISGMNMIFKEFNYCRNNQD